MRKVLGISTLALLCGVAGADAQSHTSNLDPQYYGSYALGDRAIVDGVREYGYRHTRRNSGPIYGPGYMHCINSGHPADFCQNDSTGFRTPG
jgi:hypothetical protein